MHMFAGDVGRVLGEL